VLCELFYSWISRQLITYNLINRDLHNPIEHAILEAKYFLIDIEISNRALDSSDDLNSTQYGKVTGIFCPLDWSLQKTNPSTVPMFRVLVSESRHCGPNKVTMDIRHIVKKSRLYDKAMMEAMAQHREIPITRVLSLGGVVFHESRCGSTLVANLLVAANPLAHRVYSESIPPLTVIRAQAGSREKQKELLRDVVYLMSRTQSPHETKVLFKIQSIGTHAISLWTETFPTVPWIFVYRDPVEILSSQLRNGGDEAKRAPCLRYQDSPPSQVLSLLKSLEIDIQALSKVQFCAAMLATLCQAAINEYVRNPSNGRFVNYASLPDIMWESILPNHFDVEDISEHDIERMKSISSVYSKGFGKKANRIWEQDSESKQERATDAMRQAAKEYLANYYDELERLSHGGNENDEVNAGTSEKLVT
jgi:hypothetical protein